MANVRLKFDLETLKHINLFQSITKAIVKDCVIDLNKVLFIVNEGQAGLAIGKNGSNIKNMERLIKKKVEVLEFNNDLRLFISNIIRPIKVMDIEEMVRSDDKKVIKIIIDSNRYINPKIFVKSKLKKARPLLKRYFNVDDVNLA